jgi:hypothetical protein
VRELRGLIPRVRDDALHGVLQQMLQAHERNIAMADDALKAHATAAGSGAVS